MADLVDALFGATPSQEEPPANEPTPEQAPIAPEPAVEPPAPTPVEPREEERHVPLRTFLDTRDEAREAKRERDELKRQLAERDTPKVAPDAYDDPEGFAAYSRQIIGEALQKQRMDMSFELESEKHGQEKVIEARDWAIEKAGQDPIFRAQLEQAMATQTLPLSWIVRQHKRDSVVSAIPTDVSSIDDWFEKEAQKRGYSATATAAPIPVAVAPATKPAPPPRSIANDAPASAPVALDDTADFMAAFNKR